LHIFNENLASAFSLAHVVRDGAAVVDGLYDTDKKRLMKDAANQRKLEKEQEKATKATKAAETKDLTEEQQEALEEEAKNQRKAKKQAAREEAAVKWRAANPWPSRRLSYQLRLIRWRAMVGARQPPEEPGGQEKRASVASVNHCQMPNITDACHNISSAGRLQIEQIYLD
jgi:flagellar biosynthesis GTPase FlhF